MLTSETLTAYAAALDAFVASQVPARGKAGVIQAYSAVQAIPYFSGSDRTPLAALQSGRGACTAKHLILRDVLRRIGAQASVEIVEGDFASGLPVHPSQPAALRTMIGDGGITDFHCRVRLIGNDGDCRLDATWPRSMAKYGFAVQQGWTGTGDTVQAIPQVTLRSDDEDVLGTKARLLAGLDEETARRRQDFLRLLSGWLADIGTA